MALVSEVARAAGGELAAVVFFGSRSSGVRTTAASAYDLMLVAARPPALYEAFVASGLLQRSPWLLSLLDSSLPPTQIRLSRDSWVVKAAVISTGEFERSVSSRRRDQFMAGRLFQDVHLVWARDDSAEALVDRVTRAARMITLDWAAPDLPSEFGASEYVRQLFRTSFRFEVRPESKGRADALFEAQTERLVPAFEDVLAELCAQGRLVRLDGGRYVLPRPPGISSRVARRAHMEWSRLRAVARWPKHALTFDGWLDYIVKKAERHSGETIVLTPLERRLPFVFLWPRVFRFLARQRGRGRGV